MTWDNRPSEFGAVIEASTAKLRNEIVLFIHRSLVLNSAVDTGRYRGNHQITYTSPARSPTSFESKEAGPAVSKGVSDLARGADVPYTVVWVSNNLPYAEDLENRHPVFHSNYAKAFNAAKVRYAT